MTNILSHVSLQLFVSQQGDKYYDKYHEDKCYDKCQVDKYHVTCLFTPIFMSLPLRSVVQRTNIMVCPTQTLVPEAFEEVT